LLFPQISLYAQLDEWSLNKKIRNGWMNGAKARL
jgi:hypothetical protein